MVDERDDQIVVKVPAVPAADHDFYLVAFTPASVAVLAEEHVGATPWGTDGDLHNTAVVVMHDDEITVRASGNTAREAYEAAHNRGILYRVPKRLENFAGYAI